MWAAIIAAIAANVALVFEYEGQKRQEAHNMQLAQFQADENRRLQAEQNAYNTPEAQMQRYRDARLNPHLVYGQGTPGNQSGVIPYPSIQPTDMSLDPGLFQAASLYNTGRLADAQVTAQNASVGLKQAQTELAKLQQAVISRRPELNDAGFKAMIDGLVASAALKEAQAKKEGTIADWQQQHSSAGYEKLQKEISVLDEKWNLMQVDKDVKAEILKSKEFQNDILEVQKKFMKDGDMTPQHFFQFAMSILMSILK